MRVGVAGGRSTIAAQFVQLLPEGTQVVCDRLNELPYDLDRYLVCTGFLAGRAISCIAPEEAEATFRRNFVDPARFCERVFLHNDAARVCLIGSESGFSGSFDMAYAGAKAALHLYVETKKLSHPGQQLVALAPTVIWDTAMTQRREDLGAVKARFDATRHGRALSAAEVAAEAYHALFGATCFLSNAVIRLGPGA